MATGWECDTLTTNDDAGSAAVERCDVTGWTVTPALDVVGVETPPDALPLSVTPELDAVFSVQAAYNDPLPVRGPFELEQDHPESDWPAVNVLEQSPTAAGGQSCPVAVDGATEACVVTMDGASSDIVIGGFSLVLVLLAAILAAQVRWRS